MSDAHSTAEDVRGLFGGEIVTRASCGAIDQVTQEKFAQRVQVDRVTVARWEADVQAPRGKYVIRRLEALAKKAQTR